MLKTIIKTTIWTAAIILAVGFLGCGTVLILFMGDPMPTTIAIENRSKDPISIEYRVKSNRREIEKTENLRPRESCGVYIDVRDKDVVYDIILTRHRSKSDKPKYRFKGTAGDHEVRLVFTNSNQLERHASGDRLPAVVP